MPNSGDSSRSSIETPVRKACGFEKSCSNLGIDSRCLRVNPGRGSSFEAITSSVLGGPIALDPDHVLLPAEVHPITKEQGCKRYALVALGSSSLEMVLALLTEVVAFHVRVPIVQVRLPVATSNSNDIRFRLTNAECS